MSASRFEIRQTPLAGVRVVARSRIEDRRGYLSRLYCTSELAVAGLADRIVQINHSVTHARGTVRGMHFQRPPHAETKLVACLSGEVLDVAVDLRAGSPTFLRWHAERLSAENGLALLIPEGCAHGFQAQTDDCELLYLHTHHHAPEAEGGLSPLDPALAIDWPLPIAEISDRDRDQPPVAAGFEGIVL